MNHRTISKSIVLILLSLAMITGLAGCSDNGSATESVPFSEAIGGDGVHIWYECQNKIEEENYEDLFADDNGESAESQYGRETRVVWVRVYSNGTLSTYTCKKNVYLGYFAKMTDEEIIKALDTDKDRFVCGQKEKPYTIYIYSDATGHEVRFEGVPTVIRTGEDEKVTNEDGEEETLEEIPTYFMTLISDKSVPAFQIYDSYYGGYELYNYDQTSFGGAVVVTRCEEGTVFGLDGLDLEDAVLDYDTPEDLLHELNEPYRKQREERAEKYDTEKTEDADSDPQL